MVLNDIKSNLTLGVQIIGASQVQFKGREFFGYLELSIFFRCLYFKSCHFS